jgi:hypothetical protein
MARDVDKRAVFFLAAAGLCLLILPVTPAKYRDVGIVLIVVYLVLALASWLDFRSRASGRIAGDTAARGRPKGTSE